MSASRTRMLTAAAVAGLLVTSACSSKSSAPTKAAASTSTGAGGAAATTGTTHQRRHHHHGNDDRARPAGPSFVENTNATGTPVKGGTLNMLGVGDVDYMDPNLSYYAGGYDALRLWSRQLVTFPAVAGQATTPVPDLATQLPTIANGGISKDGLTYRLHHPYRSEVEHLAGPPGHRCGHGARLEAHVQPGRALRWHARLPEADRRPRRLLHRRSPRSTPSRRARSRRTRRATTSRASRSTAATR